MNQYGIIINNFGGGGSSMLSRALAGCVALLVTIGLVWFVVLPVLGATTAVLLALAPVLMWSAILAGAGAVGVGLPLAARHYRKGCEANLVVLESWAYQMGVAQAAHRLQPVPPRAPSYVHAERQEAIER